MSRRRFFWLSLIGLILGSALLALAVRPRPGITRWNIKKIEFGMSETEVEALLGGPGLVDHEWIVSQGQWDPLPPGCIRKVWASADFGILIGFDERGIVSRAAGHMGRYICREPVWWERLLDRMGVVDWP